MNYEEHEQAYQEHVENCEDDGFHVDGCFYCGGNHPSDCCSSADRDEYWNATDDLDYGLTS